MRRSIPLVLVVDDDATATAELMSWLSKEGFNPVAARSFVEGRAVLDAVPVEVIIGHLALRDGSLFDLAHLLRAQRKGIVIGYADVDVVPPPELDACFVRPLDMEVLSSFLGRRFGRRRSGQLPRVVSDRHHSVPPAAKVPVARRSRSGR